MHLQFSSTSRYYAAFNHDEILAGIRVVKTGISYRYGSVFVVTKYRHTGLIPHFLIALHEILKPAGLITLRCYDDKRAYWERYGEFRQQITPRVSEYGLVIEKVHKYLLEREEH